MLVGISIMVDSFRDTLQVWIETTVQADIYVSPAAWRGPGEEGLLDDDLARQLAAWPGVRAVDRLRSFPVYTDTDDVLMLVGVDVGLPLASQRFTLLQGDPDSAFDLVHRQSSVLVGETLARRRDIWVGDEIHLYTTTGIRPFPVVGVYYDYDARGGGVLMDLSTLSAHWKDDGLNGLALYLQPGLDADTMVDALRAGLPVDALELMSNRRLRAEAINIFDQTFAVTRLLQAISLLIAVCGITLMLLVTAREQVSELALYKAIGATRRQVFGLFVGKGLGMGTLGLVLGAAGGVVLALLLIFIINRAYFGWTIQLHWPWGSFLEQAATILLAAVVASLYPAWMASRTPATELRREDL
jgi:putative ABC transport system permease protein